MRPAELFDLSGQVAMVTGAGSGIGASIAVTLAQAGAHVVCTDIDPGAAETTAGHIRKDNGSAQAEQLDVTRKTDVDTLVDKITAEHGTLHALCNNAGIMIDKPAADITEEEFDRVLTVNLKGVLFGCQAAARVMHEGASVVNITSAIIDKPTPGKIAYAASKAGVVQVTRHFALEFGERGIRFNAVAPSFVITGLTARHFQAPDGTIDPARLEQEKAQRSKAWALSNMFGEPEDMAMTVLFLVSPAARFWTGQVLRPNGGYQMV